MFVGENWNTEFKPEYLKFGRFIKKSPEKGEDEDSPRPEIWEQEMLTLMCGEFCTLHTWILIDLED